MERLRKGEDVFAEEFETLFPTEKEQDLIMMMFPDGRITVEISDEEVEAFMLKNGLSVMPKRTASKGQNAMVPVLFQAGEDGSVEVVLPAGAPPDTVGYNRNRGKQMEKKTKMVARLQAERERRAKK